MRREVSKAEAMEMFQNDEYKLDLIADLEEGNITVYDQGDFLRICANVKLCTALCRQCKILQKETSS